MIKNKLDNFNSSIKLESGRRFSGMGEVAGPIYAARSTKGGSVNYNVDIDEAFHLPKNIQKQLKSKVYSVINKGINKSFSGIAELSDCIFNLNDLGHGNITLNVVIDPAFGVNENALKNVERLMYNLDLDRTSKTHI